MIWAVKNQREGLRLIVRSMVTHQRIPGIKDYQAIHHKAQPTGMRRMQIIMIRVFIAFVDYRKITYLEYQSYQIRPIKHLILSSPKAHSIIYAHQSIVTYTALLSKQSQAKDGNGLHV